VAYPFAPKKKPMKLNGEAVYRHSHLQAGIGVNVTLDQSGGNPAAEIEGLFAYHLTDRSNITAKVTHTLQSETVGLGLQLINRPNAICKWLVDLWTDNTLEKKGGTFAGEYSVHDNTTLKGKCSLRNMKNQTDLRTSLSIKQKIASNVIAVLSADLNGRALVGTDMGDPHSFGLEVRLGDH